MVTSSKTVESPVGPLVLRASEDGIITISFWSKGIPEDGPRSGHIEQAELQLDEFFAGSRQNFDLKLDLSGVTEFQRSMLAELEQVPLARRAPMAS